MVEERSRYLSDEEFWTNWLDSNGKKMNYQAIIDRLQASRAASDKTDAAAARSFFESNPEHPEVHTVLTYRKGKSVLPITTDQGVAKRWREFLIKHPDLITSNSQ